MKLKLDCNLLASACCQGTEQTLHSPASLSGPQIAVRLGCAQRLRAADLETTILREAHDWTAPVLRGIFELSCLKCSEFL